MTAEDRKWRSRCDMLRKTVPDPYSGDWTCSVAVGWKSGTSNRQFVRWSEWRRLQNSDSAGWWSSSARYENISKIIGATEKHCRLKKATFLAPLAGPLGWMPPKCEMQCQGQTPVPVQNFTQIHSAVSEGMRRKHTNSELNISHYHGGDNNVI